MQKRYLYTMNMNMRKNKKSPWLLVIAIPIVALLIIYLGITFYFSDRFYFGSVINGIDYSCKTVEEVENLMSKEISNYQLELIGRNQITDTITASDVGYQFVSDGKVQALKNEQNPFFWLISFFRNSSDAEMTATTTFDEALLEKHLDNLLFFQKENMIKPKSAYVEYSEEEGYKLIPEEEGALIVRTALLNSIKDALTHSLTELDITDTDCYKSPKYTTETEKLITFYEKLKKYTNLTITYDFGDRTETLDYQKIHTLLDVDYKKLTVSINRDNVYQYVKELGYKYDTFGLPRQLTTAYGKTVTVSGGDYGWLINKDEETENLINLIKKGKSVENREPIYRYKGYSRNKNDIGDTYVEINLTKQHLWFHIDGKVFIESAFVSGNVSKGYGTPTGTYDITYKDYDTYLTGADYRSHVYYWMPFNNNIGLHDASWRNTFGGNIYKTSGSHGCVNLPSSAAKAIYENISAGIPVICYEDSSSGSNTSTTNEPTASTNPTTKPTNKPTATNKPTSKPTSKPTEKPTKAPTAKPTKAPTAKPTKAPTAKPTKAPTAKPTNKPNNDIDVQDE